MEFLVDSLKRNPKAAYSDLQAKADDKEAEGLLDHVRASPAPARHREGREARHGPIREGERGEAGRHREPLGSPRRTTSRFVVEVGPSARAARLSHECGRDREEGRGYRRARPHVKSTIGKTDRVE